MAVLLLRHRAWQRVAALSIGCVCPFVYRQYTGWVKIKYIPTWKYWYNARIFLHKIFRMYSAHISWQVCLIFLNLIFIAVAQHQSVRFFANITAKCIWLLFRCEPTLTNHFAECCHLAKLPTLFQMCSDMFINIILLCYKMRIQTLRGMCFGCEAVVAKYPTE